MSGRSAPTAGLRGAALGLAFVTALACGGQKRITGAPATPASTHAAPAQAPGATGPGAPSRASASTDSTALVASAVGPAASGGTPPSPATTSRLDETRALLALTGTHSASLGAPGGGTLRGGIALPRAGPGFIHNDKRPPDARYGTVELVHAIVKGAAAVERELPGIPLVVNDLSLPAGGPIAQHGSHQSGRDADILFYVLDSAGAPLRSVGVPLDPEGKGWDFKELPVAEDDIAVKLDAPRTWRFVQGLLEAGGEDVQRIFIVEHVRAFLLAEAERVRAPAALRQRFADVTCQPGTPHDDHMHVRFFCSPDDIGQGCLDKPPIYPWHTLALQALGLQPVLERVANRAAREQQVDERTTSRAEARKRAGPMHATVRRFLALREQWAKQPRPGRLYCK